MFDQKFSVQLIKRYYKILRYYHHDDKEDELGKNKYSDSISSFTPTDHGEKQNNIWSGQRKHLIFLSKV